MTKQLCVYYFYELWIYHGLFIRTRHCSITSVFSIIYTYRQNKKLYCRSLFYEL